MQRDGGFARAGAALNDDDAAVRMRDQLELFFIDEGGNFGQRFVGADRTATVHAEFSLGILDVFLRHHRGARCGALTAMQHRRELADRFDPLAARIFNERALRCTDAAQVALEDADIATRLHHAFGATTRDFFLVIVALFVAIIDLRDRRVAPIDDLHVGAAIDEAALADHHVARLAVHLEAKVGEVRRIDIDGQRLASTQAATQRREPRHLFDEGRQILGACFGDLVAQGQ